MKNYRVIREVLGYVRQFNGRIIVVKISKSVLADKERINNVIRDIILLKSVGVNVVVTHSDTNFMRDPWLSLEPIVFLDISTVADIEGQMAMGVTPVVFFNETLLLPSEKAVASLAIKLGAIKIVYVTNCDGIFQSGKLISEMDMAQASEMLGMLGIITHEMKNRVEVALMACRQGILRVHIVGSREGSLLKEILTCDGSGTMIYENMYREIRKAKKTDVVGIFEIVNDSIRTTSITLEFIEKNIGSFYVFAVDRQIRGCMSITEKISDPVSEIAFLGILTTYEDPLTLECLIKYALEIIPVRTECVFLDPEKNTNLLGMYPWFKELGFAKCFLNKCGISNKGNNKVWVRK